MFWNEPSLYGATFPFRDIPVQNPMLGQFAPAWQNVPRFIPPVYGLNQPFFNIPPMHLNIPQMHLNVPQVPLNVPPMHVNPLIYSQIAQPFVRPFDVPQMRWDLPLHNLYRPFF